MHSDTNASIKECGVNADTVAENPSANTTNEKKNAVIVAENPCANTTDKEFNAKIVPPPPAINV